MDLKEVMCDRAHFFPARVKKQVPPFFETKVNSLECQLGYSNFPEWCRRGSMYFESFLAEFETLAGEGKKASFTAMQMEMLDQLVSGDHFQVSSTDMNCGSGKTTVAVGATLGLLLPGDKLVVVYRPARTASPLVSQIESLVNRFSGGRAHVGTAGQQRDESIHDVVVSNDVVMTSCMLLESVLKAVVDSHRASSVTGHRRPKVYIVFDESHQIFPSMPIYVLPETPRMREFFGWLPLAGLRDMDKYRKWTVMCSIKSVGRRLSQRMATVMQSEDGEASQRDVLCADDLNLDVVGLTKGIDSLQSFVQQGLSVLDRPTASYVPTFQCLFLSAGGEFHAGARMVSSSSVIEHLFKQWFDIGVQKVISEGANEDSYRLTKVFRIHRSGAEQIGGVSEFGRPKVYEAMLNIAFNWMVKGRLLFIVRRQQVEAFSELLDEFIAKAGYYYTYTSDKQYWNSKDSSGRPLFNILLVREDELQDLEGVNIDGIKAVYLFSVGRVHDLLQKMQGVGRVGRLGQGRTYTFIMVDCATRGNAIKEGITEDVMMQALSTNSACKPHVVDVNGSRVLYDKITDIPLYDPPVITPSHESLERMMTNVRMANKKQVCKFMRCGRDGNLLCINLSRGYKCAWHHPSEKDFVKPMMLKGEEFNIRYCQRGLFSLSKSQVSAPRGILPVTVAPWSVEAVVGQGKSSECPSEETASTLYEAFFPKLGETPPRSPATPPSPAKPVKDVCAYAPPSAPAAYSGDNRSVELPSGPRTHARGPRTRPVCLYAVMGPMRCKHSRNGTRCPFRHPQIKADNVTQEEFKSALEQARANISRRNGAQAVPAHRSSATASSPSHKRESAVAVSKTPPPPVRPSGSSLPSRPLHSAAVKPSQPLRLAPKQTKKCAAGPTDGGWSTVTTRRKCHHKEEEVVQVAPIAKELTGDMYNIYDGLLSSADEDNVCVMAVSDLPDVETEALALPVPETTQTSDVVDSELKTAEAEAVSALSAQVEAKKQVEALLSCGEQGHSLVIRLRTISGEVTDFTEFSRQFMGSVLSSSDLSDLKFGWCDISRFGEALTVLAEHSLDSGVAILYAIQLHCAALGFPKYDTSGGKRSLLDTLFRLLYVKGILSTECYLQWADEDSDLHPGKLQSVIQTSEFITFLGEEEEDEGEDSCDEEESYHQKDSEETAPESNPLLEKGLTKAERKQMKRDRRSDRVAQREVELQ